MLSASTLSSLKGQSQPQPDECTNLLPPLMIKHATRKPKHVSRERSNMNESFPFSHRQYIVEEPDEAVLTPLLPPIPTHFSAATTWFYRVLSGILSTLFLIFFVLLGALI